VSEAALHRDERAIKILAGVGIPVAAFLHGYAGFIFGSVKANALWMTPLMPVIFIMSAIVSGIALSMLAYIVIQEVRKYRARAKKSRGAGERDIGGTEKHVIAMTLRYLIVFLVFAISLELLDLVFRGYTAVKHWDILRTVIYDRDFRNVFILQYLVGNLVPLILFLVPRASTTRVLVGLVLVLFGVFMMRWNVVIGGQAFSLTFAGYMDYLMPIIPRDWTTFKEGLGGVLLVLATPFAFFAFLTRFFPVFGGARQQ
jgi:Ni/Fe-hydrogenase subunit HybB-like protein